MRSTSNSINRPCLALCIFFFSIQLSNPKTRTSITMYMFHSWNTLDGAQFLRQLFVGRYPRQSPPDNNNNKNGSDNADHSSDSANGHYNVDAVSLCFVRLRDGVFRGDLREQRDGFPRRSARPDLECPVPREGLRRTRHLLEVHVQADVRCLCQRRSISKRQFSKKSAKEERYFLKRSSANRKYSNSLNGVHDPCLVYSCA